jgi:hypothetical protein
MPARLIAALLTLALSRAAAAEPEWITDAQGRRFRIRFDPGQRLWAGGGALGVADQGASGIAPAAEIGLALRAPPPSALADVFWKRDHRLGDLRLRPDGGLVLEGTLYHGIFLRHSRESSLTIPTTPPLRLALPFDAGVRIELGRLTGTLPLAALDAGVVRGEALADFLRSEHPGRWLALGAVGYYDVRVERRGPGPLWRDHRVMPLTGVSLSAAGESDRGLVSGELRAEWGRAWSSQRGWGPAYRVQAQAEVTPIAVNDLPLSLILAAGVEAGNHTPDGAPRLRAFAGLRLGAPLPQ